jgi:hypothetical protein
LNPWEWPNPLIPKMLSEMKLAKIKMNLMEIGLLFIFFELLTKTTKAMERLEAN